MIQSKCSICGKDLMSNDGYIIEQDLTDPDRKSIKILKEPQVKYWAHDPRNLHVDVEVIAHKECYDKIKADHKDFDQPVQDYATCKYPTLDKDGKVVLKTPDKYKQDQDKTLADEKAAKGIN